MENVEQKYILDLTEELSESFLDFFKDNGFEVLKRSEVEEMSQLDYILVSSNEGAIEASNDFATAKNNIDIVSIGASDNIQKFLIHEGRLSISEKILDLEIGEVVLRNFFNKEKSIHLEENFGDTFESIDNFSITNHLSAGDSFDKTCYSALKSGFNLLSLRTFLDHSLLYLSYLKQSGEAEFPIVYEYSKAKEIFAVNIQINVQDFFAEYLFESFGSVGMSAPQKYLMNILEQTSDYLDICYLSKANKLVISGLWDKSGTNSLKGIGFHQIETANKQIRNKNQNREYDLAGSFDSHKQLNNSSTTQLPGSLLDDKLKLDELSAIKSDFDSILVKVIENYRESYPEGEISSVSMEQLEELIPGSLESPLSQNDKEVLLENIRKEDVKQLMSDKLEAIKEEFIGDSDFQEELVSISADTLAEDVSQSIKGNALEDFLESTLVKGLDEEEDDNITIGGEDGVDEDEKIKIKGGKDAADDFKQTIKGLEEDDISELVQSFSSSLDEKESAQTISGGNINSMAKSWVVKSLGSSSTSGNSSSVKAFLRDTAPKEIENKLKSFANGMGKEFKDLSAKELNDFKTTMLPQVINEMVSGNKSVDDFADKLAGVKSTNKKSSFDFERMSERDPALSEFGNEFKANLVQKIKTLGADVPKEELQSVLKQTIKEKVSSILEDSSLDKNQKEAKKAVLVEQMSETLGISKDEVEAMISSGTAKSKKAVEELVMQKVADSDTKPEILKQSSLDAQLSLRLKQVEEENFKLKESLKAVKLQSEAKERTQSTIEKLNKEVSIDEDGLGFDGEEDFKIDNSELVSKLETIQELSKEDKDKIAKLLNEGESVHMEAQKNVRKLELEASKREVVFSQELERAEKTAKAKDYVIEKAKEAVRNTIIKKDQELQSMKSQLHSLSQKIEGNNNSSLEKEYKQMRSQNENLAKTTEMYKNKIETLSKKISEAKGDSNVAQISEENKTLKRVKVNLERQAEGSIKQSKKLAEKLQKASSSEMKLKIENKSLMSDLKTSQHQLRRLKEQSEAAVSMVKKSVASQSDQLTKEFDLVQSKNLSLNESLRLAQNKIEELTKASKLAKVNEGNEDALEKKYTKEVKRLNSELEQGQAKVKALEAKVDEITKAKIAAEKEQTAAPKGAVDPVKQRLERSVKKLNAEMVKAQSEANEHKKSAFKAGKEVTGLKNQLATLKKELEKAKKQVTDKTKKAA